MSDWLQTGSRANGQEWINGLYQQQARQTAGGQLASGQTRQAANTLFQSGDLRGGRDLQEAAREEETARRTSEGLARAEQLAATQRVARALRTARDQGQDPIAAFQAYKPAIAAMGTPPEQIAEIEQLITANPQFIDQIDDFATRELEIVNYGSGRGFAVVDKGSGQIVNGAAPERDPMDVGGVLIDPTTREVILDTREPKYQTIQNVDGTTSVVAIDQPAPIRGAGGATDPDTILDRLLEREGGFVASDGRSGAPANFGINQRANPDIDVRNLTPERARSIYQERYIAPIVNAGVSGPALEAVIDFGVNAGVNRSLEFWRQSGGDIEKFNELRLSHYRSLPDYAQNGRSWERRVAETTPGQRGSSVPVGGGARVVASGSGGQAARLLTEEEKRAQGLPIGGVYERQADGSTRQITPPGAGGGRGGGSLDATTRGALQAARNAAEAARDRAAAAQRFVELNRQRATGPGARVAGPLLSVDPVYGEMRAIGAKLVPGEREPGSGTMSDRDVALYREAVIGVQNPGPTNAALARVITAQARRDSEYAAFLDEYATRNGSIAGATEDWDAYVNANPLFERGGEGNTRVRPNVQSWRQFMGYGERQRGGGASSAPASSSAPAAPRVRFQPTEAQTRLSQQIVGSRSREGRRGERTNPVLINPRDPTSSYANVPRGGYFITPDGQLRGPKP